MDHTGDETDTVTWTGERREDAKRHAGSRVQLTVFKIKAVEVQAFDQVSQRLGLERRHGRITHLTEETETIPQTEIS